MIILHNANIYDCGIRLGASAVAIGGGRIIAIGGPEILELSQGKVDIVNLEGKTIFPGFVDSHFHMEHYIQSLQMVNCETTTKAACLDQVIQKVRTTPPGEWILGHGWNQNAWQDGYGHKEELDKIAPNHPVYLTAKSLHAAWANSSALTISGLTSQSVDPSDGVLQRDGEGNLTGILFEGAMELVSNHIPRPTPVDLSKRIQLAQKRLAAMGITGIHDFDSSRCFAAFQILEQTGTLDIRILKSIPQINLDSAILTGLASGAGSDMLRAGSLKLFSDGALGPGTAAMLAPYEDALDCGMLLMSEEEIFETGLSAAKAGISLSIHAIGDFANRTAINAIARIRDVEIQNKMPFLRHRIEHVQVISPDDISRMKRNQIIASVQPIHISSDKDTCDLKWGKRSEFAYAFHSLIEAGITTMFGSDAPVEPFNPFWGIYSAVARKHYRERIDTPSWYPQQRISLQQAILCYTRNPAYAAEMEDRSGRIAPNFLADMVLLKEDPFSIPIEDVRNLMPVGTIVDGRWVYRTF